MHFSHRDRPARSLAAFATIPDRPRLEPLDLNWKLWIGVLISAGLLWLAARDVDFASAWRYIQTINPYYLVPYLGLVAIEVILRAWKWQVLLAPIKRASFRNLISATLIGLMANNVLPARAGEFVRAYVGARKERIAFTASFATVAVDRLLDGLTVSAIFVLAVVVQPLRDEVKLGGYTAAALYAGALAFFVILVTKEDLAFRIVGSVLRFFPERAAQFITRLLRSFVTGLGALKDGRLLATAIFISVLIWLGYALTVFVMALAMDIQLTLLQAFVVLLIVTILLTLPSTPGFLGAMELGITWGLVLFGVDTSQAFAFALVYHVTQYVPVTVAGFVALSLEGMGMRDISHVQPPDTVGADPA
jgi:glycosyltransferase 2 family protein